MEITLDFEENAFVHWLHLLYILVDDYDKSITIKC